MLRTRDHAFLLCLLPEGGVWVFVFPVWVFPKLADERLALLLVPALFPVRDDLLLQHLLGQLLTQL